MTFSTRPSSPIGRGDWLRTSAVGVRIPRGVPVALVMLAGSTPLDLGPLAEKAADMPTLWWCRSL